ncbi:MAG TPA: PAS domain S-box protein [Segetibacter sp.]|jgi:PAS domain S-box-containing protein
MKPGIKVFIIILCISISICSLFLIGSIFKVEFLNISNKSVAVHPLTVETLILAVLSLILIFIISIGRLSGSKDETTLALLQEIQSRTQTEEKLKESNRFLDAIIENFPDIVFVKNADLKYIKINKATAGLLNKTQDEVLGKTDHELFSKEEADKILLKDTEVLRTGKLTEAYEQLVVVNNKTYWFSTHKFPVVDNNGKPTYIIGIARDITEQKKQHEQIKEFNKDLEKKVSERTEQLFKSEQRFRTLIENGVDVISMTDRNGVLFYVSPSIKNLMGFTDVEMMNRDGKSFLHPDDLPIAEDLFKQVIAEPGVPKTSIIRVIHKEGYPIWVEGTIINQLNEESVGAVIANYHDITDRLRVEEEKQTLEAALIEEKIQRQKDIAQATLDGQEKERTAIGMEMHDNINQILGVVKLYLGLAKTKPQIMNEMIDKCEENIVLCIKESRKLSKSLVTTNIYKYGLHFAIQDLIEDFKEYGLEFVYEVDKDKIKELDNKIQFSLYRIIQEQLTNISKHAEASRVTIKIYRDDDKLELIIADDGKGFDPLSSRRGIGLGNIQNRVELLNGTFDITSSPGKGCTLNIHLSC